MAVDEAIDLMTRFAERTGLSSERPPRRYLWTDAFAVCNFLSLQRATGDASYLELAHRLVDQVHHTLGRHRRDDSRTGWISGLPEDQGEAHPTLGGLRIGKPLPERGPDELPDENLEWDRDGQYFHYLTKWMHALHQLAGVTGNPRYDVWARELADAAHRAFVVGHGHRRMCWKMSIDLTRPLVPSMGQHDPLDGYVTCAELAATGSAGPDLRHAIADFDALLDRSSLATADPLGLGGLLVDASRVTQLQLAPALRETLIAAALVGLRHYVELPEIRMPAERRLAFRELGLAIGLDAIAELDRSVTARLARYAPLRDRLAELWLEPKSRQCRPWREHQDINDVMLATTLLPEGFTRLTRS